MRVTISKRTRKKHKYAFAKGDPNILYVVSINGKSVEFFRTRREALKAAKQYRLRNKNG